MKKQSIKEPIKLLVIRLADIKENKAKLMARGIAYDYEKAIKLFDEEIAQYTRAIMILKGKYRA